MKKKMKRRFVETAQALLNRQNIQSNRKRVRNEIRKEEGPYLTYKSILQRNKPGKRL